MQIKFFWFTKICTPAPGLSYTPTLTPASTPYYVIHPQLPEQLPTGWSRSWAPPTTWPPQAPAPLPQSRGRAQPPCRCRSPCHAGTAGPSPPHWSKSRPLCHVAAAGPSTPTKQQVPAMPQPHGHGRSQPPTRTGPGHPPRGLSWPPSTAASLHAAPLARPHSSCRSWSQ